MKDKALEKKLMQQLLTLERTIDYCGDAPVRHKISEYIVEIRKLVKGPVTPGYD